MNKISLHGISSHTDIHKLMRDIGILHSSIYDITVREVDQQHIGHAIYSHIFLMFMRESW